VSFEQQVHPVLVAKCKVCHRSASHVFRVTGNASDDLPFAQAQATPADPASSTLLRKATGNDHRGGTRIRPTDPEYGTILAWIQQGAR